MGSEHRREEELQGACWDTCAICSAFHLDCAPPVLVSAHISLGMHHTSDMFEMPVEDDKDHPLLLSVCQPFSQTAEQRSRLMTK